MPTYGYECKSCTHTFDAFQSIKDEPLKTCPKCGKEVRRLINGGTGIIFKGGGFYVTDKKGSSTVSTKSGSSPSAEKPTAGKTAAPQTATTSTAVSSPSEAATSGGDKTTASTPASKAASS